MNGIRFICDGIERIVHSGEMTTEDCLRQQLYKVFNLSTRNDLIGVQNNETNRLYSLQEVVMNPSLFGTTPGILVVTPLSPKTQKRYSTVVEKIFEYVFDECNHQNEFKYLDYYVLRILYNRKLSCFTYAMNLLLDRDINGLSEYLHSIVEHNKNKVDIKMDILRLIIINMQMNKELSSEETQLLLSLIRREDSQVCSVYTLFEMNDDLTQLKQSLYQLLGITLKPEPMKSVNPQHGSWFNTNDSVEVDLISKELDESFIIIYSLYELALINEREGSQLLQRVSESPSIAHSFIETMKQQERSISQTTWYTSFLSDCNPSQSLTYSFHCPVYPYKELVNALMKLKDNHMISCTEYIELYKRCLFDSPALLHCYSSVTKKNHQSAFANMIRFCGNAYHILKQDGDDIEMCSEDPAVLEEISTKHLLHDDEVSWLLREYRGKNSIIMNAFSVYRETGIEGLTSIIQSAMVMFNHYQNEREAKEFLKLLVKEMMKNELINERQAMILSFKIKENDQMLIEYYNQYKERESFEELLTNIIHSISDNPYGNEVGKESLHLPFQQGSIESHKDLEDCLSKNAME